MKIEELRIGNLVNYNISNSLFQGKVTAITKNRLVVDKVTSKFMNVYGIELSDELLLKFGFDKIGFQFIKDGIELFPIRDLYYRGNFPIKSDIKFVHQLQNLYFALTGSELQYVA